ncbi:GNAT family N-acetyltransferase [Streptomyces formicae]|uniref:GNAT family N-acetyltransferase n=1 Tax=Streptomyces formicae TaxID=1616117 RepID=A0ABY3WCN1_9ACTN|nr:GNAT family N-acetyltransferase [Streptomyces formicae]UNM10308.1 GNAT family N-acetyltransferase [Streptomyces formicae]
MSGRPWPGRPPGPGGHGASAAEAVRLRRLNRWQAECLQEDLGDLYVESSGAPAGEEYRNRQDFLRRLTDDVRRPGFALVVAETTTLVGCAFGFPVRRDGSWWRGFAGGLPRSVEQLTASGHVFAITEIVVHPHEQDRDIARRLQERLVADHHASLGTILVPAADRAAHAAFRSWGWQEIGEVHRPPGPTVLRALVLPLGKRTAANPDGLAHDARTQRPE